MHGFVSFFRGTPLLVPHFLFYYILPQVVPAFGAIDGVTAAMIGVTLRFATYIAENLWAAVLPEDRGQ